MQNEDVSFTENEILDPSEDEVLDYTYSITSYGADYPIDALIKRMHSKTIKVPLFQRGFVWDEKKASRFIESLLLGLPVPGIFLAKDIDSPDLLVIDGQQRLKSLQFFYNGLINEKKFRLIEVQERFNNKTYEELDIDDRLRLDDSIIHATIIKQDEPSDDNSSIYLIFERLNTGGLVLQPQEIRTAIYSGEFVSLLNKLNEEKNWKEIYGASNKRMKSQEFILRFFALFLYREKYSKPLKGFLNTYMSKNRHLKLHDEAMLKKLFKRNIDYLVDTLGKSAFRPKRAINASIYDSVMVGLANRFEYNNEPPAKDKFLSAYYDLLRDSNYIEATTDATSDEAVVERRMNTVIEKFKQI